MLILFINNPQNKASKNIFSDICNDEKMGQLINPSKIPHQEKS